MPHPSLNPAFLPERKRDADHVNSSRCIKEIRGAAAAGETPTLQTPVTSGNGHSDDQRYWIPVLLVVLTAALITWIGMAQFSTEPAHQQSSVIPSAGEPGQNQAEVTRIPPFPVRTEPRQICQHPGTGLCRAQARPGLRCPHRVSLGGEPGEPTQLLGQSPLVIAPPQEPEQISSDVAADRLPAAQAEVKERPK